MSLPALPCKGMACLSAVTVVLTVMLSAACSAAQPNAARLVHSVPSPFPTPELCARAPRAVQFSPEKNWLICAGPQQSASTFTLFSLLDTRLRQSFDVSLKRGEFLDFFSWAPDGSGAIYVVYASDGATVQGIALLSLSPDGAADVSQLDLSADQGTAPPFGGLRAAWSPDARYIALSVRPSRINIVDRQTSVVRQLGPTRANENLNLRLWNDRGLFYFTNARRSDARLQLTLVRVCGDSREAMGSVPPNDIERQLNMMSARSDVCSVAW